MALSVRRTRTRSLHSRCSRVALASITAAGVLVAGCTSDDDPPDEGPDETVEPTDPDDGEPSEEPEDEAAEDDGAEPIVLDLDLEERSADGSLIRLSRFEADGEALLLDVEIVVAAARAFVQFDNRQQGTPAMLRDDLGNEYLLVELEDNRSLRVSGGDRLEGTLAYEGPLDPDASTLQVIFNEERNPEPETQYDQLMPYFVFPSFDLEDGTVVGDGDAGGTQDAVEPLEVDVELEQQAADGTTMRVTRLEVTDLSILVDVHVVVAEERTNIWLNNQMSTPAVVRDDQGNDYALVPVQGNRALGVSGGEQLEGTLSFQGPLEPDATSLEVVFNEESDPEGATQNDRAFPRFVFGPIELPTAGD